MGEWRVVANLALVLGFLLWRYDNQCIRVEETVDWSVFRRAPLCGWR